MFTKFTIRIFTQNKSFICVLFFSLQFQFAVTQENQELKDLQNKIVRVNAKIDILKDSIDSLNKKISEIQSDAFKKKIKDSTIIAYTKEGAPLKKNPVPWGSLIKKLKDNTRIIVIDYSEGYFKVCTTNNCGFLNEVWVQKNKILTEFIGIKTGKNLPAYELRSSGSVSKPKNYIKTRKYKSGRTYYRGPRGGCYYINSNGNKIYVDRNKC